MCVDVDFLFFKGETYMNNMTSIAEAFVVAAEKSDVARQIIREHEARETVRKVKSEQARWRRWRERQQPTKA